MNKNLLIARKNDFIYNGNNFCAEQLRWINTEERKSYLKVIILEEPLIINEINRKIKKNQCHKVVEEFITNEFPQNNEILYDYKYNCKNKKLYITYMRSNRELNEFCMKFTHISIMPFQYFMQKKCQIKYKKILNSYCAVCLIYGIYYFIEVADNIILNNFCSSYIQKIQDAIVKSQRNTIVLIEFNQFPMTDVNKSKLSANKNLKIINGDYLC